MTIPQLVGQVSMASRRACESAARYHIQDVVRREEIAQTGGGRWSQAARAQVWEPVLAALVRVATPLADL